MRRIKHRILVAVAAAMAAAAPALADFSWFNSTTSRITYASGGANYLAGQLTDSNVSCFVQLIFAGTNNTNDVAVNSATGTTNDDVVIATSWIGKNPSSHQGVKGVDVQTNDVSGFYFVRVWTAPSPDFSGGLVPVSPTNLYGDSRLFAANPSCDLPFCETNFDFGGNGGFATTLSPGITDTDSDGLPDWWESAYFSNPTSASATADAESDGQDNFAEYVSGTDPTNSASVFEVEVFSGVTGGEAVIQWSSVTGKLYEVRRYTNLTAGYTIQATNLPATPPLNSFTDTTAGVDFYIYGVGVK